MAPSAIAEVLINKETRPQVASPAPHPARPRPAVERGPARGRGFFNEALLENHRFKSSSKTLDYLVALLFHVAVIGVPILAGLYYTDTLNLKEFTRTLLVAPPPPPPPPPAPASVVKAQAPKHVFMTGGKLVAPTVIPRQIAEIKEAPLEPDSLGGVAGGVPGGVPGGQMGGVLGGVIGGVLNTAARPIAPPTGKPSAPVRVGGRVRPPKAIVQTHPNYPPLARQARIQGQVQIDAILDEQGNVIDMKVVSGPPLLYQAALDALKTWKYEPTYLNDQPIAVEMIVTITFQLGQ
jgi:periplasmic protein TonB